MPDVMGLVILAVAVALFFDFTNGFNDAANAIATSVGSRALTPRAAVAMAAALNLVGALVSTSVAETVAGKILDPASVTQITLMAALLAASGWNSLATYLGLPVSASHALLAGLVGAGLGSGGIEIVKWSGVIKIFWAILLSPVVGFIMAFLLILLLTRIVWKASPARVTRFFKPAQVASAAYMAFSHGSNDAQKTMGVITLALFSAGLLPELVVPLWVKVAAALAMGLGTAFGGWRVIRTLGMRLTHLRPIHGFSAETSAASVIWANSLLGLPISTTHVISAAVMGVGASKRLSAVRWGVGFNIILAWLLTLPVCALLAWLIVKLLRVL